MSTPNIDLSVLVSGGSGFLGSWVVIELLQRGFSVRATIRNLARANAVRKSIEPRVSTERLTFVQADLLEDAGWAEAMAGIRYVLHVASPLPVGDFANADIVAIARQGVQRVVGAARNAGVEKLVMTSSAEAARPTSPDQAFSETVWTEVSDQTSAYVRSKILSERDAWETVSVPGSPKLTTILPTFIQGPVLSDDFSPSIAAVQNMLAGNMPAVPRTGFYVIDVRDLAKLHVDAMIAPATDGHRIIATGDYAWLIDIAGYLRKALGEQAAKAPTVEMPDDVVRAAAETNPALKQALPQLGVRPQIDSDKANRLLGWQPRPVSETIADSGRSLLYLGLAG